MRAQRRDGCGRATAAQGFPCAESEQPTQFCSGQVPRPEFLNRQRFQCSPRQITRRAETAREIIGDVNDYVHATILGGAFVVKNDRE
jgi:hypothetical protein